MFSWPLELSVPGGFVVNFTILDVIDFSWIWGEQPYR